MSTVKQRTNRQGHSLTEVREEAIVVMAEVFKLGYLRYGNTSSLKVLFQYLQDCQPDEFGGLLMEAEERATEEIVEAEAHRGDPSVQIMDHFRKGFLGLVLRDELARLEEVTPESEEVH